MNAKIDTQVNTFVNIAIFFIRIGLTKMKIKNGWDVLIAVEE